MNTTPDWYALMEFTKGKWDIMLDEERVQVLKAYPKHVEEVQRRERKRAHRQAWENLCPPEYRNTVYEDLPKVSEFEKVQKWQYGPMGLLLVGPTRQGKTRSAWKLLERLHFTEKRRIKAFNPMDLKLAVANAWRDPETAEEFVEDLRDVAVLFLDDLDTVKFTEAVEETIYDVFEYRPTHQKPVIATVNRTGRELAARMNANGRGARIVERMREFCEIVNFIPEVVR